MTLVTCPYCKKKLPQLIDDDGYVETITNHYCVDGIRMSRERFSGLDMNVTDTTVHDDSLARTG